MSRSLGGFVRDLYPEAMSEEEFPACERHESKVPMKLTTMHSDSAQPDVLVGLFECPECGHERRLPIQTREAA